MKDKNQDFTDPPLGKQNIGDQPPKTVFIFNFFIFNGIYLFMLIYSMYMKILPTSVILPFLLSVPGIVTAILNIVIPVLIYKKYIPEIQYFTKSENGIHQANRALKKYSAISIAVPMILTIIGTVVSILWLKIDEPAKIFSCVFSSLGSLCIFGLLFYVLYIQKLENWASFLPLKTEYVTMSYITRGMLVAFFLFFAVFFLTSAPIIAMIYNGTDIIYTFMHSVLPAAGIVMVLSIFINFRLYNHLNNHIEDIMQLTEELSAGNFAGTPLLVKSRDMFGVLVNHLNNFQKHTGNLLTSVVHNTQLMSGVGKELSSNMIETASVVQKISTSIGGVKQQVMTQAASVTETAATVEEIIRTIKQLNASIENQVTSVAQSSSSVEQMVTNITSITHTLNTTNDVIKTLATATTDGKETIRSSTEVTQKIAEESGSLLEASNVIQHIASQTNLLAMNAAIEAAHAGEAGKGFAVVADEIRKLAEESSAQGKTITATLKTLSGEIETLSESSKTAGDTFNSIFALSEQVKDMSSRLMSAMREQENGSREVLEAIRTINTVTTEVQIGSGEMLRGGEGVAGEMQKLDGLTRIITDSMNEMALGIVQISNAVLGVNEITQKNTESIENLAKEVKKFKV